MLSLNVFSKITLFTHIKKGLFFGKNYSFTDKKKGGFLGLTQFDYIRMLIILFGCIYSLNFNGTFILF